MTNEEAIEAMNGVWVTELQEAVDKAVEALEKQVPKRPFEDPVDVNCPSCLATLYRKGMVRYRRKPKFCRECGQAIDWSDEK